MAENKETQEVKNLVTTTNKVIKWEQDTWEILNHMADYTGTDINTMANAAVLTLSDLEVDELVDIMNEAHQRKIEAFKANAAAEKEE